MTTVLAVIVTFNRSKLLARCIDHIERQTRQVDNILVINNGSTDDTEEMLTTRSVEYVTQANSGGAGGFQRGLQEAVDRGYDMVWLMDDDGFPDDRALSILLDTLADPALLCACSIVVRESEPDFFVWPFPRLNKDNHPAQFVRNRKLPTVSQLRAKVVGDIYPFAHLFNGTLLRTNAVNIVGWIETGFFIAGDEVDFAMRLIDKRAIVSNVNALHFHPDVTSRSISTKYFYYYLKNNIIINKRYTNNATFRSMLCVAAGIRRVVQQNSFSDALSYIFGRKAKVLVRAILNGARGRIGADFER